jgi:hypothetical protein
MMSHQQPFCDANTDAALRTFVEEEARVIDKTIHDATSDAILRTSDQPSLMPSSKPSPKLYTNSPFVMPAEPSLRKRNALVIICCLACLSMMRSDIVKAIHDAATDAILRTSDQPSLMPSSKPPSKPFDNTKLEAKQQATFKTIFNAIPGLIYLQNSPA